MGTAVFLLTCTASIRCLNKIRVQLLATLFIMVGGVSKNKNRNLLSGQRLNSYCSLGFCNLFVALVFLMCVCVFKWNLFFFSVMPVEPLGIFEMRLLCFILWNEF